MGSVKLLHYNSNYLIAPLSPILQTIASLGYQAAMLPRLTNCINPLYPLLFIHPVVLTILWPQSSLGTVDLGQVHYEPLKDRQGNVLLVTLREFPNPPR